MTSAAASKVKLESQLIELAKKNDIDQLVHTAEKLELTELDDQALTATFFNVLCVAYLVQGDKYSARFALRRAKTFQNAPETPHCELLSRAVWNHQDSVALQLLEQFDFFTLGAQLATAIIQRAVTSFAQSYANPSIEQVCKHLGIKTQTVAASLPAGVRVASNGILEMEEAYVKQYAQDRVTLLTDSALLLGQQDA